jgi:hypothetical protein
MLRLSAVLTPNSDTLLPVRRENSKYRSAAPLPKNSSSSPLKAETHLDFGKEERARAAELYCKLMILKKLQRNATKVEENFDSGSGPSRAALLRTGHIPRCRIFYNLDNRGSQSCSRWADFSTDSRPILFPESFKNRPQL